MSRIVIETVKGTYTYQDEQAEELRRRIFEDGDRFIQLLHPHNDTYIPLTAIAKVTWRDVE